MVPRPEKTSFSKSLTLQPLQLQTDTDTFCADVKVNETEPKRGEKGEKFLSIALNFEALNYRGTLA